MRIKYLQLHKPLNIPGPGKATNKLSATGQAGLDRIGAVKAIHYANCGYILEVATGPHAGFYEVPASNVDHAGVEYTFAEQHALGYITEDEWAEIMTFAAMSEQEQNAIAASINFNPNKVKQIRAEFPKLATEPGEQPQTEPTDTDE